MIMRILRWFKRSETAEETREPEHPESDKREFDRYSVTFPVIILSRDAKGFESTEKTILQDISGKGALFRSRIPDRYYPGQLLKISIVLDGTSDVRARVHTEATVVRIHNDGGLAKSWNDNESAVGIAVQFDRSFDFERIDHLDMGQVDEIGS